MQPDPVMVSIISLVPLKPDLSLALFSSNLSHSHCPQHSAGFSLLRVSNGEDGEERVFKRGSSLKAMAVLSHCLHYRQGWSMALLFFLSF